MKDMLTALKTIRRAKYNFYQQELDFQWGGGGVNIKYGDL